NDCRIGRDMLWPYDPAGIPILLDDSSHQARNPETIGAHLDCLYSASGMLDLCAERCRVAGAKLENMTNLGSSNRGQCILAFRTAGALCGSGEIGKHIDIEVAATVQIGQEMSEPRRSHDEVGTRSNGLVRDHDNGAGCPNERDPIV